MRNQIHIVTDFLTGYLDINLCGRNIFEIQGIYLSLV